MICYVPPSNDCALTCPDLDIRSQSAGTLVILTLVNLTGIVSSGFCYQLLPSQRGSRHSRIRTALQVHSLLDFLFLLWYMTLIYTLRLSVLDECYTCRAIHMGIMRMGKGVLTMLRNYTAVWIGFQRYLLTCRPREMRVAPRGNRVARCRTAYQGALALTAVLLLNLPQLIDYILLQCSNHVDESRVLIFRKVHVLGSILVAIIIPLCLVIIFSQRILVQTRKLIHLHRHQLPMPGVTTARIRLSCLHLNRVMLAFMFTYVVLTAPGLWQLGFYLFKLLRDEDCKLQRLPTGVWIMSAICACLISTTDFVIYFFFWPSFRRRTIDFARRGCQLFVQNPCGR